MKDPFGTIGAARRKLPRMMFDFIDGGTGLENAQANNRHALDEISLQSRVLKNVEEISLTTKLFDRTFGLPFGFAPMGMCNLIHPSADDALSTAAKTRDIPHCVSTAASTVMEQSQKDAGGNAWFQLYAGSDNAVTFEMVERAESAGYDHLIFTVDTPRHSRRTRDLENGFSVPLKIGPRQFLDFAAHPAWSLSMLRAMVLIGAPAPMNYKTSTNGFQFIRSDSRGGADFEFLQQLRDRWKGKLIVKGVNTTEDAVRIKNACCDALYVSNHGGRQLDSGMPAIDTLPTIRKAVGKKYPIIYDSGIRVGDDIVRALALGADFVMLGRPLLFALGAGGPKALDLFLDRMEADLRSVMAQIGTTSIDECDSSRVAAKRVTK